MSHTDFIIYRICYATDYYSSLSILNDVVAYNDLSFNQRKRDYLYEM